MTWISPNAIDIVRIPQTEEYMGNTYSQRKQDVKFLEVRQVQRDWSAYSRELSRGSTEAERGHIKLIAFFFCSRNNEIHKFIRKRPQYIFTLLSNYPISDPLFHKKII